MEVGQEVVSRPVVGGVDTHKDLHVAAVVDEHDHVLGTRCFATTRQGYRQMLAWMRSFGQVHASALSRLAAMAPGSCASCSRLASRFWRSRPRINMIGADGARTMISTLRMLRMPPLPANAPSRPEAAMAWSNPCVFSRLAGRQPLLARRIALQMIQNTIVCAPDGLRDPLRTMTRMQLVRTLAAWRPDLTAYRNVDSAYRISLKSLARRYLELHDEIADLDAMIAAIVDELAPDLVARNSIGHAGAAQLLLTAGDNPERLHSEAGFAALCGVSPVPASSGKTTRHRLNRGGDRAANSALHIIAIGQASNRSANQGLHGQTHRRGPFQARGHPVPQALHRSRGVHLNQSAGKRRSTRLGSPLDK